jgi:hypothetical protein
MLPVQSSRVSFISLAALLACVFAAPAGAADYQGKAQALMPTPKEIGYTQLLQFRRAKKPAANLAPGFQEGVAAIYAKGTTKAPVEAAATVYVYSTPAAAKTAWQRACPGCPHVLVHGVQMRYQARKVNGTVAFENFTICRNVYVNAITAGEPATKLANDAGTIAGAVYRRAAHFGMSRCK